jgi:hypothetical protein
VDALSFCQVSSMAPKKAVLSMLHILFGLETVSFLFVDVYYMQPHKGSCIVTMLCKR